MLNQAQESIVALPYMLSPQAAKVQSLWHTIFPGSKRLLTSDSNRYGNNTDVRAPEDDDELWHGGFISAGGGSSTRIREFVKSTLDGVFFADGGFAGPNQLGSWEHTAAAQEAFQACAKLAIAVPAKAA